MLIVLHKEYLLVANSVALHTIVADVEYEVCMDTMSYSTYLCFQGVCKGQLGR